MSVRKLEEQLRDYKNMITAEADEEKIKNVIRRSQESFYAAEQERMLSYHEFLWVQLRLIQKRWWILQFLLLCMSGILLLSACEESYIQRGMGVMASLFVILVIPELWRNRANQCMEIEEASYYSLRQIYAARMVLFGVVDILLLTMFCTAVTVGFHFAFMELLVQFLLPMTVTACICFGTLCSRRILSETAAIMLCILWSAAWSLIVLNERIYTIITLPVWLVLAGGSLVFLGLAIYRILKNCSDYLEVAVDEIGIE